MDRLVTEALVVVVELIWQELLQPEEPVQAVLHKATSEELEQLMLNTQV